MNKLIVNIMFLNLFFCTAIAQNHYVILVDGAGKARSRENISSLRNMLTDSIPSLIFRKGIQINDTLKLKSSGNDYFSIAYYGLLSHNKVKCQGGELSKTLLPELKKANLKKDYLHKIIELEHAVTYDELSKILRKSVNSEERYWYGYPSISDYMFMASLENINNTIQNVIIFIVVTDIEYNGISLRDERGSIEKYIENFKAFKEIHKKIDKEYKKEKIKTIQTENIFADVYNFFPKLHNAFTDSFPSAAIKRIELIDINDVNAKYKIQFNEAFNKYIDKHQNIIENVRISLIINNDTIKTIKNNSDIIFHFNYSGIPKCDLNKIKTDVVFSFLVNDKIFGKKWLHINSENNLLESPQSCNVWYKVKMALLLIAIVLILIAAIIYCWFRFFKTNVYYTISTTGSYNKCNREKKEITVNVNEAFSIYFELKKINYLNFVSQLAHNSILVESNKGKFKTRNFPVTIDVNQGDEIKVTQQSFVKASNIEILIKHQSIKSHE